MIGRANHPTFGYYNLSSEYYDSIINWQAVRNDVKDLPEEAIGYENGVLAVLLPHESGVAAYLGAFATPHKYLPEYTPYSSQNPLQAPTSP